MTLGAGAVARVETDEAAAERRRRPLATCSARWRPTRRSTRGDRHEARVRIAAQAARSGGGGPRPPATTSRASCCTSRTRRHVRATAAARAPRSPRQGGVWTTPPHPDHEHEGHDRPPDGGLFRGRDRRVGAGPARRRRSPTSAPPTPRSRRSPAASCASRRAARTTPSTPSTSPPASARRWRTCCTSAPDEIVLLLLRTPHVYGRAPRAHRALTPR